METTDNITALRSCLEELDQSSRLLREALMQRNPDAIWEAVARQEKAIAEFTHLREIPGLFEALPPEQDREIKEIVARTRITQRINKALTRVFMKIIDKTLNTIVNPTGAEPLTYSPAGQYTRSTGPLFVQQTG